MESMRWHRFKDVVAKVMEWDRREWPARLVAECGDDVDLFFEASSLLAFSPAVGDFIETPAWHAVSESGAPFRSAPRTE